MKLSLILDRIEEGVALFTDGDGRVYTCSADLLPEGTREGESFFAETHGDALFSLEKRDNPRAGENKKRLSALFNKQKQ